jgi:hypothetical protein
MSTQRISTEFQLQPIFFSALHSNDFYFLEWLNDIKIVFFAINLANTLDVETTTYLPLVCKWQVLLILRYHIYYSLCLQYLKIDDLTNLWV